MSRSATWCFVCLALLAGACPAANADDSDVEPRKSDGYWRLQGGWSHDSGSDAGAVSAAAGISFFRHAPIDLLEFSWREHDDADVYSLLTNVYYVPFPNWRISPFAGVGVGFGWLSGSRNHRFIWNSRAGAEFRVLERASFVAEYRFLMDHDNEHLHEVLLGAKLKFY